MSINMINIIRVERNIRPKDLGLKRNIIKKTSDEETRTYNNENHDSHRFCTEVSASSIHFDEG